MIAKQPVMLTDVRYPVGRKKSRKNRGKFSLTLKRVLIEFSIKLFICIRFKLADIIQTKRRLQLTYIRNSDIDPATETRAEPH